MNVLIMLSKANSIFADSLKRAGEVNQISVTIYLFDEGSNTSLASCREELKGIIKKKKIDKLLSFNDLGNGKEYLLDDSVFNMAPCNMWLVDSIQRDTREYAAHLKKFSRIFSFEPTDVPYCQAKFGVTIQYFPFAAGDELFCSNPKDFSEEEQYDISFVGLVAGNQRRLAVLNAAAQICKKYNYKMALYGHFWHNHHWLQSVIGALKFRLKYPDLYPFVHNRRMDPADVSTLYRNTKVNLNIHMPHFHTAPSARTFEIMGNNNFELCDNQDFSGIKLIPGKHLDVYTDTEDLKKKLRYYLENKELRKQMAIEGGKIVRKYYTLNRCLTHVLE